VQNSKWLAIGLCIAFVAGAYYAWNYSFGQFNANPVSSSCTAASAGGRFRIASVNLSLQGGEAAVSNGIQSQTLSIQIDNEGQSPISSIEVCVNNIPIVAENGPFPQGTSKVLFLPVPTTISVNPGGTYLVSVKGTFPGQTEGEPSTSYLQSQNVVAVG